MKKTIWGLLFSFVLCLSGGESYFEESYQNKVDRNALEQEIKEALAKASSALPDTEHFVKQTRMADYLFADCLEKRLELMKRLIRYIRAEQNRKQQPEGVLYASHGARELIQFLEYFQLEKERFSVSKQKPLLFSVDRFGAKGDGVSDNTQAFQRALDEIRKRKGAPAVLKIPKGKYRFKTLNPRGLPVDTVMRHQSTCYPTTFRPSHLLIRNLKNLTIEGDADTELLFDHSTYVDGIALWGCDNVMVRNLILDFTNTPFTQGTILKSDFGKNEVILRVDEGHLPLIGPSHFRNFLKGTMLYSADGKQLIHEAGIFHPSEIQDLGERRYRYRLTGPAATKERFRLLTPGRKMLLMARYNGHANAFLSTRSRFVTADHVSAYSSPCGGFTDIVGYGASYIDCKLIPRPGSGNLSASNADGFTSAHSVIGLYMKRCEISQIGDDGLCTYNKVAQITSISADRRQLTYQYRERIYPGARVAILDSVTGKVKAEALCIAEKNNTATFSEPLPAGIRTQENLYEDCLTDNDTLLYFPTISKKRVLNDLLICLSRSNIGSIVSDSHFHMHRGDAVHLESPNSLVENTRIDNIGVFGISVTGRNLYIEPMAPHNVILRNNRISHCFIPIFSSYSHETGGVRHPVLRDLLVENNFCGASRSGRPPEFNNVGHLILRGMNVKPRIVHCSDVMLDGRKIQ